MPVVLLSLLLGSTGISGDALAPYRGQPILSVDVISPNEKDAAQLRPLIGIEPGYLLSTDDLQAALRRIYALGRFSDVGVSAERRSGTVSLYFYVQPIRRLTGLEIDGLEAADGDALREALRINSGDEIDSKTAARVEQRARIYLERAGFPQAEILVEVNSEVSQTSASIRVVVDEGEPLRVRRVRFTGRPRLKRNVLTRLVGTEAGGVADRDVIEEDGRRLARQYRKHGFLSAQIHTPAVRVQDGYADVTFDTEAGDRVAVELRGTTLLTRKDLLSLWPEPSGALREADVPLFAERVSEACHRLGYPRARARVRATRDAAEETLTYVIDVDEGAPFRVTKIDFVGARAFAPRLLAEQVRAVLSRQLESDDVIRVLSADRPCLAFRAHLRPAAKRCPLVELPPEQRWVPEIYKAALEEITAAYASFGFLSATVGPAEPQFGDDTITVRIPVVEGPQTFIDTIQFRDNEALPSEQLLGIIEKATTSETHDVAIAPGSPLSAAGIEDGRIAILRHYRDLGYLYAKVFADVEVSDDGKSAEVLYRFEEGPAVRIDRVLIRGNRFTRENVIRDRLSTRPGDLYRLEQALEDQRTVAALGVFSSVRVKLLDERTPAERKDLVAEVVERKRHRIEPHIGLSTADGIRGGVAYTFINVLGTGATGTGSIRLNRQFLFGLYGEFAKPMRTRYEEFSTIDQIEREMRAGVSSPRWVNLPLDPTARVDFVHERDNAIPYSLDSYAVILGLDTLLTDRLTLTIEPQFAVSSLDCVTIDVESVDKTRCVEQLPGARPAIGRTQEGIRQVFKVGPSITLDLRDNPFNPRSGLRASAGVTYAVGNVGSDLQSGTRQPLTFTKAQASVAMYVPWRTLVLALSAGGGIIARRSELEQIDERFFLGGRGSLRGFVDSALIAEDACIDERPADADDNWTPPPPPDGCNEQIVTPEGVAPLTTGGNAFVLGKAELRMPLTPDFSFGIFVDVGNLWALPPDLSSFGALSKLRVRYGLGAGLRFNTPVGPLAFDVGFNPEPNEAQGERLYVPHFSVGVF